MELKDIAKEQLLAQIIAERDQMIIQLATENNQLKTVVNNLKQDLKARENTKEESA